MTPFMEKISTIAGWASLGIGCLTLVLVLSPRHSGWPTSLLMIGLGWSFLHNTHTLRAPDPANPPPVGLRPLRAVLLLHLGCLGVWGLGLGQRFVRWGYLPEVGVQNAVLCIGLALCLLAAHDLAHGRRWVQFTLTVGLLTATTPSVFRPSLSQLPAQESTPVQLGIAALAVLYLALLVARRWVR